MRGAVILTKKEKVEVRDFPNPSPGHGQVVLRIMASSVCGSDLRAIYRRDAEAADPAEVYRDVICGHEPAGVITAIGKGVMRFKPGDRVCIYHVAGCGVCRHCREGTVISCQLARAAYGFQRHGGMGDYFSPKKVAACPCRGCLSRTSAIIACGGGTTYEALSTGA